jgi:hypothetical protein
LALRAGEEQRFPIPFVQGLHVLADDWRNAFGITMTRLRASDFGDAKANRRRAIPAVAE